MSFWYEEWAYGLLASSLMNFRLSLVCCRNFSRTSYPAKLTSVFSFLTLGAKARLLLSLIHI